MDAAKHQSSGAEHPGYRVKAGWLFWATVYELYCKVRHPGRRWEMECPYCDETFRASSWNRVVLKTDIHVSAEEDEDHFTGDATTAADQPEDGGEDSNPDLVVEGGWQR